MTTSDWGSAGSPRADFHHAPRQPGAPRSQAAGSHFVHPAHAGTPARQTGAQEDWGHAHVPGFGAPHAYGTAPGPAMGPAAEPAAPADGHRRSGQGANGAGQGRRDATALGDAPAAPLARTFTLLGGLLSVVLVLGLAFWGYKLAVRDVAGVPVIEALEGPMRVPPDDPGGDVARHQGLAVNVVAGEAVTGGPVDQVVLAPPAVALAPEDVPPRPRRPVERPAGDAAATGTGTGTGTQAGTDDAAAAPAVPAGRVAAVDAAIAEALGLIDGAGDGDAVGDAAPENATGAATAGWSLRPKPKPARLFQAALTPGDSQASDRPATAPTAPAALTAPAGSVGRIAAPTSAPVTTGEEITDAAIDTGVRLVQLGAFETPEIAREQWQEIANRFGDLFVDRDWTIQKAQSGGRTFYRLRALGFDDLGAAQTFCATLMAANTTCIPVVTQ